MKNWETLEPDVTKLMARHFTPGRAGRQIRMVVMHHNAGNLSVEDCWQTWQTRQATAHYKFKLTDVSVRWSTTAIPLGMLGTGQ